ncbi:MAG: hypothetical protein ABL958_17840 [Bdellovibrionia bacterium]
MTKNRKIFDSLSQAFPLKPIRDDEHLNAAVKALDKVKVYLAKNPSEKEEVEKYLSELRDLVQEYKNKQPVH